MKFTRPVILHLAYFFLSTMAVGQTGFSYFLLEAYMLDTRGTRNGLAELGEEIIGLMSLSGGYEFQLDDSRSAGLDADPAIRNFAPEHCEQLSLNNRRSESSVI